jgi:hypothetical protein
LQNNKQITTFTEMKKITLVFLLILPFVAFSQNCNKYLKKNKNNSSSIFDNSNVVNTKWIQFYGEGARKMYFQFSNKDGKNTLIIQQQTTKNVQFKQRLTLGTSIEIAFIFDDNSHYILKFENPQEDLGILLNKYYASRNFYQISTELDNLLSNKLLASIEIKNPFSSSNLNSDKILVEKAKNASKIKIAYGCFKDNIK